MIEPILREHPSGTASAGARKSPELKECFLRLPDIPTIVIICTSLDIDFVCIFCHETKGVMLSCIIRNLYNDQQ
ncbi:MAG: hypothetical protein ABF309_07380 [Desulfobacterales bacterium]